MSWLLAYTEVSGHCKLKVMGNEQLQAGGDAPMQASVAIFMQQ